MTRLSSRPSDGAHLFDVRRGRVLDARLAARVHADHRSLVASRRRYHIPVPPEPDDRTLRLIQAHRGLPGPFFTASHQQARYEQRQEHHADGDQSQ